jgi:hypothetical protein
MYIYVSTAEISIHARGPMTNSKYVLGSGTRKRVSPYITPPSKVRHPTNPSSTKCRDPVLELSGFHHHGGYSRDVLSG